jgi:hypothetical protein
MKKIYLILSFTLPVLGAYAQTCVGPNSGTTGANEAVTGSTTAWGSLTAGGASDNTYVISGSLPTNGNYTDRFVISGLGFSLPNTAVITGIQVELEKSVTGGSNIADREVMLVKAGVTQTTANKAITGTAWPTTDVVTSYGNSLDLWGNTWTYTDINDPGFGVAVAAQRFSASGPPQQARIDQIRVTVCYSLLAPLQVTGFYGWVQNNEVILNWQGQNEWNTDYYEVEQSQNGSTFYSQARVQKGSSTLNNYTWKTPCEGNSFYRIRQTDKNGGVFYTGVAKLSCNATDLQLVRSGKKIMISGLSGNNAVILSVYTAHGQQVATKTWGANGYSGLIEYELPTLPGNEIYRVVVSNGTQKASKAILPSR